MYKDLLRDAQSLPYYITDAEFEKFSQAIL